MGRIVSFIFWTSSQLTAYVNSSGWETTYTEIVPSDRLRPKSSEPSISAKTFITFQLEVPRELQVIRNPTCLSGVVEPDFFGRFF